MIESLVANQSPIVSALFYLAAALMISYAILRISITLRVAGTNQRPGHADSVHVANTILQRCFQHSIPVTFGELEKMTLGTEQIISQQSFEHAYVDYDYPLISSKVATVNKAQLVKKYIPRATEGKGQKKTVLRLGKQSMLNSAIELQVQSLRRVRGL